jgi:uridine kinase
MASDRSALLGEIAAAISGISRSHPVRVAVDGPSASGKTTLADALADRFRALGRSCLRATLDDFHRPGHKQRSMGGDWTPSLYEREGYDFPAFRALLLDPLGPGGDRRVRTGIFDAARDQALPERWTRVAADAVVVIDGLYLLGRLADSFDYRIWLSVRPETVLARACERDVAWVGSLEAVRARYEGFWLPAHARYEATAPASRADLVIEND